MSTIHYFNLSNGMECVIEPGYHSDEIEEPRFSRIQSTWCEQKRWNDLLLTLPPDMYVQLALGNTVTVHDKSEKDRITRACWQGLALVRVASNLAWFGVTTPEFSRNGMNVTAYFTSVWRDLPETTQRYVRWYRKWIEGDGRMITVDRLGPCNCWMPAQQIVLEAAA